MAGKTGEEAKMIAPKSVPERDGCRLLFLGGIIGHKSRERDVQPVVLCRWEGFFKIAR